MKQKDQRISQGMMIGLNRQNAILRRSRTEKVQQKRELGKEIYNLTLKIKENSEAIDRIVVDLFGKEDKEAEEQ